MIGAATHLVRGLAMPYKLLVQGLCEDPDGKAFRFRMADGAFRGYLNAPDSEVFLAVEHDESFRLAWRSQGDLRVRETPDGLMFEADLAGYPDRDLADRILQNVASGRICGVSCSFTYARNDTEDTETPNGIERTIRKACLDEISLCHTGKSIKARAKVVGAPPADIREVRREIAIDEYHGRGTTMERLKRTLALDLLEVNRQSRAYR